MADTKKTSGWAIVIDRYAGQYLIIVVLAIARLYYITVGRISHAYSKYRDPAIMNTLFNEYLQAGGNWMQSQLLMAHTSSQSSEINGVEEFV